MLNKFVALNRILARKLEKSFPNFLKDEDRMGDLKNRIESCLVTSMPSNILEVGGIDRPLLSKSEDYRYIGVDVEEETSCYEIYDEFYVRSVEDELPTDIDMIISTTVLEHVSNNRKAINSMYLALNTGGWMHHYVPSKNHPYSIALRLVGPKLQKKLIHYLRPEVESITGYPTFFDHCSTKQMRKLIRSCGFTDVNIKTYYKATDYFDFFLPAYIVVAIFEIMAQRLGLDTFGSGFLVSARKT